MNVAVVDYGLSNLTCVRAAIDRLGHDSTVAARPEDLDGADRIVLPGVGAFGDAMANLNAAGMVEALNEAVHRKGTPFLGICLGAQLICKDSDEYGTHEGLGWADAHVRKLEPGAAALRVPHTGWDDVAAQGDSELFAGVPDDALFYYTHSHAIHANDKDIVRGTCDYGTNFAAVLRVGENIHATQFHPEKSQKYGLAMLGNFLEWCG